MNVKHGRVMVKDTVVTMMVEAFGLQNLENHWGAHEVASTNSPGVGNATQETPSYLANDGLPYTWPDRVRSALRPLRALPARDGGAERFFLQAAGHIWVIPFQLFLEKISNHT